MFENNRDLAVGGGEALEAKRQSFLRNMSEVAQFIRAGRLHNVSPCQERLSKNDAKSVLVTQELLTRYNPIKDLTEAERIDASARRVGLQNPTQYSEEQELGRGTSLANMDKTKKSDD